jgi:hypothetical protein
MRSYFPVSNFPVAASVSAFRQENAEEKLPFKPQRHRGTEKNLLMPFHSVPLQQADGMRQPGRLSLTAYLGRSHGINRSAVSLPALGCFDCQHPCGCPKNPGYNGADQSRCKQHAKLRITDVRQKEMDDGTQ